MTSPPDTSRTDQSSLQQPLPVELHLRQRHGAAVGPDPEAGVERLREAAGEGVDVDHGVLGDAVEGQRAGGPVQVNPHPAGEGDRGAGLEPAVVVARRVASLRTLHAPRPAVQPQQAARRRPVPAEPVGGHAHVGAAAPLHLPVHRVQQPLPAQDLRAELEPVRVVQMVRGPARRPQTGHCPVAVGQAQLGVGSAGVKGQITGVWEQMEKDQLI